MILIEIQASEECGINYSTAKSIVKLMKNEGRIDKKKKRATRKNRMQINELEMMIRGKPSNESPQWDSPHIPGLHCMYHLSYRL